MVGMGRAVYLPVIDGAGEGSEPGEMVLSQVLSTLFHWSFIRVWLWLLSQKTAFSLERLLSAVPGASRIIRILAVALISLLLPQQISQQRPDERQKSRSQKILTHVHICSEHSQDDASN